MFFFCVKLCFFRKTPTYTDKLKKQNLLKMNQCQKYSVRCIRSRHIQYYVAITRLLGNHMAVHLNYLKCIHRGIDSDCGGRVSSDLVINHYLNIMGQFKLQ